MASGGLFQSQEATEKLQKTLQCGGSEGSDGAVRGELCRDMCDYRSKTISKI